MRGLPRGSVVNGGVGGEYRRRMVGGPEATCVVGFGGLMVLSEFTIIGVKFHFLEECPLLVLEGKVLGFSAI